MTDKPDRVERTVHDCTDCDGADPREYYWGTDDDVVVEEPPELPIPTPSPPDFLATLPDPHLPPTSPWLRDIDLDEIDFAPLLALVESLLPDARRLAEWSDDGEVGDWVKDEYSNERAVNELTGEWIREGTFGETGVKLLNVVFNRWADLDRVLYPSGLLGSYAALCGDDQRRHDAVRCLYDLKSTVFFGSDFDLLEDWGDDDSETAFPQTSLSLRPGSRLGLSHALFVKRLEYVARLLRDITGPGKAKRSRMTVSEADQRAKELTDTPGKKKKFFSMSLRKQAKRIGCHLGTYTKTDCYQDAVKLGWIAPKKVRSNKGQPPARRVSMTPKLEASVGAGERDGVLKRLADEEAGEVERREWVDLPLAERQALLAEHEADDASDPSPVKCRPRKPSRRDNS